MPLPEVVFFLVVFFLLGLMVGTGLEGEPDRQSGTDAALMAELEALRSTLLLSVKAWSAHRALDGAARQQPRLPEQPAG